MNSVLAILFSFIAVVAAVCPEVPEIENFNPGKFTGIWNRIKGSPLDRNDLCLKDKVEFHTQYNTINIATSWQDKLSGLQHSSPTTAYLTNKTNVFDIHWDGRPGTHEHLEIVDTDYDNYAIIFVCGHFNETKYPNEAFIVGRKTTLPTKILNKAVETVAQYGFTDLKDVDHNCNPLDYAVKSITGLFDFLRSVQG